MHVKCARSHSYLCSRFDFFSSRNPWGLLHHCLSLLQIQDLGSNLVSLGNTLRCLLLLFLPHHLHQREVSSSLPPKHLSFLLLQLSHLLQPAHYTVKDSLDLKPVETSRPCSEINCMNLHVNKDTVRFYRLPEHIHNRNRQTGMAYT